MPVRGWSWAVLISVVVGCGSVAPPVEPASRQVARSPDADASRAAPVPGPAARREAPPPIPKPLPRACTSGEQCYDNGRNAMDHGDMQLAIPLLSGACFRRHAPACNTLAKMYTFGRGVVRNFDRALSYFERSCRIGQVRDCIHAGRFFEAGRGRPVNTEEAFTFYMIACKAREMEGCFRGGLLHVKGLLRPRKIFIARSLFEKACAARHQESCDQIAKMWRPIPRANFRSVHLQVNGLTTEELICRLEGSGLINGESVVSALALHTGELHRCVPRPARPRVRWRFSGGKTAVEEIRGVTDDVRRCLVKTLTRVKHGLNGTCSALLALGK